MAAPCSAFFHDTSVLCGSNDVSAAALNEKVTFAGWKELPTCYMVSEMDQAIPHVTANGSWPKASQVNLKAEALLRDWRASAGR